MKKRGAFLVLFVSIVFLISLVSFASADTNTTSSDVSTRAYICLNNLISGKCSSLSTEEKIFSLLAVESCKSELLSDSLSNQCWPSSGCKIKTTAQAILALNHVNSPTSSAEDWLLSQTMNFPDIDWILQVESANETSCTASYSGGSYGFTLNEDRTINGNAGNCLTVYNNYWLKISPSCYNEDFQISCSNSFLTSLLYKQKTSPTIYVSEKTNSASGEGTTTERVSSSCFKEGSSCSYEGTLWAALVLKYKGHDVSAYIPYLVTMADTNQKYVPYSFLYILTNEFRTDLLAQQAEGKWWSLSGDKFYDTAVALLPFSNEEPTEKSNSISWLQEVQGSDGCWQDNIRNTAFLLASIWPKAPSVQNTTLQDCENSGYYCLSSASCSDLGGSTLTNYGGCFGTNVCCDKAQQVQSCSQQNGELCSSGETCLGGSTVSSSDTTSSKTCCIEGSCGTPQTQSSECEISGGICKTSCSSGEDTVSYACSSSSFTCCVQKPASSINIVVIIILVILIILVVIGIIFRKKLRLFFSKLFRGKGKPRSMPPGGPRFPPYPSSRVYPGAVQRRIIPQRPAAPARRPLPQKKSEFDEVLNKLKEIGK